MFYEFCLRSFSDKDFKHLYLKFTYIEKFANRNEKESIIKHMKKTFMHLKNFEKDYPEIYPFLENIQNTDNILQKIITTHIFILQNHNKPFGKTTVILPIQITGSSYHIENIHLIDPNDVKDFNSKLFTVPPKNDIEKVMNDFELSPSARHIKQRILKEIQNKHQGYYTNLINNDITPTL